MTLKAPLFPPQDSVNGSFHWIEQGGVFTVACWEPYRWFGLYWNVFGLKECSPRALGMAGWRYHSPLPFPKKED